MSPTHPLNAAAEPAASSIIFRVTAFWQSTITVAQNPEVESNVDASAESMLPTQVKIKWKGGVVPFICFVSSLLKAPALLPLHLLNVLSVSKPTRIYVFPAMDCCFGGGMKSQHHFLVLDVILSPAQTLLPETSPRRSNAHSKKTRGMTLVH
jgi:hypothetical protein